MVLGPTSGLSEENTKVIGKETLCMDRVFILGPTVESMMANTYQI